MARRTPAARVTSWGPAGRTIPAASRTPAGNRYRGRHHGRGRRHRSVGLPMGADARSRRDPAVRRLPALHAAGNLRPGEEPGLPRAVLVLRLRPDRGRHERAVRVPPGPALRRRRPPMPVRAASWTPRPTPASRRPRVSTGVAESSVTVTPIAVRENAAPSPRGRFAGLQALQVLLTKKGGKPCP